jgi:hypothetical protein
VRITKDFNKHTHDGDSYKHSHTHDGSDHWHSHEHTHSHGGHSHEHGDVKEDKEVFALITYMLSHNRHHAQELRELADRLLNSGKSEAAAVLSEAVSFFEEGNDRLEKTVNLLK